VLIISIFNDNMRIIIMWTKPTYNDIRLGFEITMYFKAD
tara:strand:+ start:30384 stop:30500 length:117 start_codon:yes stop_codon:yes gene_type:complete